MPKKKDRQQEEEQETFRVPLPQGEQVFGIVIDKVGGGKFKVYCSDGNERICRIPGAKRKFMWVNVDSIVIVEPWSAQSDERGDIVLNYRKAQIQWLKKKKHLQPLEEFL